jgi:hypothetical protein
VDRGSPRLTVPVSVVTTAGNVPQVLVVDKGVVRRRQIETGATGLEGVVVKSGLERDAQVRSHHLSGRLRPGSRGHRAFRHPARPPRRPIEPRGRDQGLM